jgi:hypothetical protein
MYALNVKRGFSVRYAITDAHSDAKTISVTLSRVTVHASKHMLEIIAIIVFPESLDVIANLTVLKDA